MGNLGEKTQYLEFFRGPLDGLRRLVTVGVLDAIYPHPRQAANETGLHLFYTYQRQYKVINGERDDQAMVFVGEEWR